MTTSHRLVLTLAASLAVACSTPAPVNQPDSSIDAGVVDASEKKAAAIPLFSIPGGSYVGAQTVSVTTTTSTATIYYTLDGNPPTTGSQTYTAPIAIGATTTLKAYAVAEGFSDSPVNAATYTIAAPPTPIAATPTISPASGTYSAAQQVTITTTEPGGTLIYTTDGSLPSKTVGSVYTAPFTVGKDTSVIAITRADKKDDSATAKAVYKIEIPMGTTAPPSFSIAAGEYASAQTVTMSTATSGASICYTTDGTTPACDATTKACSTSSTRFLTINPLTLDSNQTVMAIACITGNIDSTVTSAIYSFRPPVPTVSASGTVDFDTVAKANIANVPGSVLLYTHKVDGTTPDDPTVATTGTCTPATGTTAIANSDLPWNIAKAIDPAITTTGLRRTAKYKFRSCKVGYHLSAVVSADENVRLKVTLSTTTPAFGTINYQVTPAFDDAQITATTLGASATVGTFCYTSDGTTTPLCSLSKTGCTVGATTLSVGSLIVDNLAQRDLKVIACKPETLDSEVLSGTYTFKLRLGYDVALSPTPGSQQPLGAFTFYPVAWQGAPSTAINGVGTKYVYITVDGTTPVLPSTCGDVPTGTAQRLTGASGLGSVSVNNTTLGSTVKMIACSASYLTSDLVTYTYLAP